jgi:hypothetical protein
MESHVAQIVSPDSQGIGPDRAAREIVTCILDTDAYIVLFRKS